MLRLHYLNEGQGEVIRDASRSFQRDKGEEIARHTLAFLERKPMP